MYSIRGKELLVESQSYSFDYDVRKVIPYKDRFIVLLEIPNDSDSINNIYCIDSNAKCVWRVYDLKSAGLGYKDYLPYEGMSLVEDTLIATDYYGRRFRIDPETGMILGSGNDGGRLW